MRLVIGPTHSGLPAPILKELAGEASAKFNGFCTKSTAPSSLARCASAGLHDLLNRITGGCSGHRAKSSEPSRSGTPLRRARKSSLSDCPALVPKARGSAGPPEAESSAKEASGQSFSRRVASAPMIANRIASWGRRRSICQCCVLTPWRISSRWRMGAVAPSRSFCA